MRDINEKDRERLFHQIVKVEQEEDDLRSIKKRHEQSLENFVGEFRSISSSLFSIKSSSGDFSLATIKPGSY